MRALLAVLYTAALCVAVFVISYIGMSEDLTSGAAPVPGTCRHRVYADNLAINLLSNMMYALAAGLAFYRGYAKIATLLGVVTIVSTIHHVHRNAPGLWTTLDESMASLAAVCIAYVMWQTWSGMSPRIATVLTCVIAGTGLFAYSWYTDDTMTPKIYSNTSHAFWHMLTATAAIVYFV